MQELSFESTEYIDQETFAGWVRRRPRGDVNRYELLNRRVVMTPPAGHPHGSTELNVGFLLKSFVKSLPAARRGRAFGSSQGFELPSGDTVGADASYISPERWRAGPAPEDGKFLRIVPDLVVEILSPSTASRDRGEKRAIYEKNGVREYWLVDPRAQSVRRFVLGDDGYGTGECFEANDCFESVVLDGLSFDVAELFEA